MEEEIQNYFSGINEVYEHVLIFIDNPDPDSEEDFTNLLQIIDTHGIDVNEEKFHHFISLLVNLANNHHRHTSFFSKIERILSRYRRKIQENSTNNEIFIEFASNKRLIYFLMKEGILKFDTKIAEIIKSKHEFICDGYSDFFNNEIEKSENCKEENEIEMTEYEQKRQIGENDLYICSLIRQGLVEEFISYVTRHNISLSSRIKPSIFETNSFLIDKEPTLIEYAAFFGSIQIYEYLYLNGVAVNGSLWLYGIHSNNSDFLRNHIESKGIKPTDETCEEILNESIKCHHNEIARYIQENLIDEKQMIKSKNRIQFNERVFNIAFKYNNYSFFLANFNDGCAFCNCCQYKYDTIVDLLIKSHRNLIEKKIIQEKLLFNKIYLHN